MVAGQHGLHGLSVQPLVVLQSKLVVAHAQIQSLNMVVAYVLDKNVPRYIVTLLHTVHHIQPYLWMVDGVSGGPGEDVLLHVGLVSSIGNVHAPGQPQKMEDHLVQAVRKIARFVEIGHAQR